VRPALAGRRSAGPSAGRRSPVRARRLARPTTWPLSGPPPPPPPAPPHPTPPRPAPPRPPSSDQLSVQRFYCYASDACLAIADPARNPQGRVVFILDVGDFGWRNFDVHGAKTLFCMMSVRALV
jgi:hypothetical protein